VVLDGHIHIRAGQEDPSVLRPALEKAGVDGGVVISLPPRSFGWGTGAAAERLDDLFRWTGSGTDLFPFFWIDPIEPDAAEQVGLAVQRGVSGFKVICDRFYPGDGRAIGVFRQIAAEGKPILFHSGILWDGKPSGKYNPPVEFEALIEVAGLRFALAHLSWPWCDECIAVYGKFLNAQSRRRNFSVEMFIDVTPGTPPIYRRDALTKLFAVGYHVENNVLFGTDCCANDYNDAWAREWIDRDNAIYKDLGLSTETLEGVFGANLRRFIGLSTDSVTRRTPRPAQ